MTILCSVLLFIICKAQNQFEIFPNLGGVDNQSQLFSLFVEGDSIYAIGSLIDTTIDPADPETRPWLAAFNYYGDQFHSNILNDTISKNTLFVRKNQFIPYNDNKLYFTESFNQEGSARATLLELNLMSGNINNSKTFYNPIDSTEYILPRSLSIWPGNPKQLALAMIIENSGILQGYVLIVDSNFNITNEIIIEDNGRNNYIYKVKVESDSTIVLIGNSNKRNDHGIFKDIKPYYMKINTSGSILKFNTLKGLSNPTILFGPADTQAILDNDDGDWVISCLAVFPTGNCSDCFYRIPYIIALSEDFSTILWYKAFNDNDTTNQRHLISSLIKTKDDSGYILSGYNYNKPHYDSYIFKVSHDGDSLWSRHFIPLNWDIERVFWAELQDIKITNTNTIVAGGTVADLDSLIWKSWILHLDSLGCLIPGCALVSSTKEIGETNNSFLIYPNPASHELYVLCRTPFQVPVELQIITQAGIIRHRRSLQMEAGAQYILPIDHLTPGIYHLVFKTDTKVVESHSFIKS